MGFIMVRINIANKSKILWTSSTLSPRLSGEGSQHDQLSQWVAESKGLVRTAVNVTDEAALAAHVDMLKVGNAGLLCLF